jgi:hypothetical protein
MSFSLFLHYNKIIPTFTITNSILIHFETHAEFLGFCSKIFGRTIFSTLNRKGVLAARASPGLPDFTWYM